MNLSNPQYKALLSHYKTWLEALGYANNTVKSWTSQVKNYLQYLETKQIKNLENLTVNQHENYKLHLEAKQISTAYLAQHLIAVNVFNRCLTHSSHHQTSLPGYYKIPQASSHTQILTAQEITQLYQATKQENNQALQSRAKVILSLFYGTGLRLSETHKLDLTDIDLQNRTIQIRQGKGRKDRQVPIMPRQAQELETYLQEHRDWFTYRHHQSNKPQVQRKPDIDKEALILNQFGQRLGKGGLGTLINKLKNRTTINKPVSPHKLRHSIASHLLQNGMELEKIKTFLGHSTLESTQIYLHLVNKE